MKPPTTHISILLSCTMSRFCVWGPNKSAYTPTLMTKHARSETCYHYPLCAVSTNLHCSQRSNLCRLHQELVVRLGPLQLRAETKSVLGAPTSPANPTDSTNQFSLTKLLRPLPLLPLCLVSAHPLLTLFLPSAYPLVTLVLQSGSSGRRNPAYPPSA
jgi:hypothetical protein